MARRIASLAVWLLLASLPCAAAQEQYRVGPATFAGVADRPHLGVRAQGAVIWNAGYDKDNPKPERPAPSLALYFAESGWDVFTLHRKLIADSAAVETAALLRAIDQVRRNGYGRIVLMGQSAGAWLSIIAAAERRDIDSVIALAPACCGRRSTGDSWLNNRDRLYPLLQQTHAAKVVLAFFSGDDYDPGGRGPASDEILKKLGVPHFIIDRPAYPGLADHGAGQSVNFSRRFGTCIYAFVQSGKTPRCDDDRAALNDLGVVLPADLQPDPAWPLGGLWIGTWSIGRFAALVIEKDAGDGRVQARYMTGPGASPGREPAGTARWVMRRDKAGLHVESTTQRFDFVVTDEHTMRGTITGRNGGSATAIFRRAEQ